MKKSSPTKPVTPLAPARTPSGRVLNVRPDTVDFRDLMYVPSLVEVPSEMPLRDYEAFKVPILDQGQEGACTGFGLATVVNYLLRRRKVVPDQTPCSPWMLYELARRYDEWPGEEYEGSSARGAMKGWHKHGVSSDEAWQKHQRICLPVCEDAIKRPLGAYSRVNHKDLVAIHAALAEVGILYGTALVHEGWEQVNASTGVIPRRPAMLGGHAFAIVGFNSDGLWIQNSWGPRCGLNGFALITYDDWLANGTDLWVARLGAPSRIVMPEGAANRVSGGAVRIDASTNFELRPHVVSIGNDGQLRQTGEFGNSEQDVAELFSQSFAQITKDWSKKRILLYAHGGLVSERAAVQRVAEYRQTLLDNQIYPLAFIWKSDYWTTLTNILKDALSRRRPEGILDGAKDFMLDRLDDGLEPLARVLTGKAEWDEMKENALLATASRHGGARLVAQHLANLSDSSVEIHVVGHSAGAILHAPLVQLLTTKGKIAAGELKGESGFGLKIATCTLWAPACTMALFESAYLPSIKNNQIGAFALFTLTDQAEQDDDCAHIYHKSLLYFVSNAFEEKARIPVFRDGVPLLGMEKFVRKNPALLHLLSTKKADWVQAPNQARPGSPSHSTALHHGDFDDDRPTVTATLARILDVKNTAAQFNFSRSASSRRDRRRGFNGL